MRKLNIQTIMLLSLAQLNQAAARHLHMLKPILLDDVKPMRLDNDEWNNDEGKNNYESNTSDEESSDEESMSDGEKILSLFQNLDKNNDNTIDIEEVRNMSAETKAMVDNFKKDGNFSNHIDNLTHQWLRRFELDEDTVKTYWEIYLKEMEKLNEAATDGALTRKEWDAYLRDNKIKNFPQHFIDALFGQGNKCGQNEFVRIIHAFVPHSFGDYRAKIVNILRAMDNGHGKVDKKDLQDFKEGNRINSNEKKEGKKFNNRMLDIIKNDEQAKIYWSGLERQQEKGEIIYIKNVDKDFEIERLLNTLDENSDGEISINEVNKFLAEEKNAKWLKSAAKDPSTAYIVNNLKNQFKRRYHLKSETFNLYKSISAKAMEVFNSNAGKDGELQKDEYEKYFAGLNDQQKALLKSKITDDFKKQLFGDDGKEVLAQNIYMFMPGGDDVKEKILSVARAIGKKGVINEKKIEKFFKNPLNKNYVDAIIKDKEGMDHQEALKKIYEEGNNIIKADQINKYFNTLKPAAELKEKKPPAVEKADEKEPVAEEKKGDIKDSKPEPKKNVNTAAKKDDKKKSVHEEAKKKGENAKQKDPFKKKDKKAAA